MDKPNRHIILYKIVLSISVLFPFLEANGQSLIQNPLETGVFFFWIKVAFTVFVAVLIPIYWKHWGPANFLWFSDVALFGCVVALWTESALVASMMAVGVLIPEIYWNLELFVRLLTGNKLAGLTDYMWDKEKPLYLRLLSLFHVPIPIILIWMLYNWGYDVNAIYYHTILAWIVLLLSYKFSSREENINWVFGPGKEPQDRISKGKYFLLVLALFPLVLFLPTHLLLTWMF